MTKRNVKEIKSKIIQGLDLAYTRMLTSKQKADDDIIISKNGKIVRVKARELTKQ